MLEHPVPATHAEMNYTDLYAVDGMSKIWDQFPDVCAMAMVSKVSCGWMNQLINLKFSWALHGDGKHKLHHGRWVLLTFGTHCLNWDVDAKVYRHSFRPLVYLFSKQIESVASVRFAMVALQIIAVQLFGQRYALL
jgi:hypothetical protein